MCLNKILYLKLTIFHINSEQNHVSLSETRLLIWQVVVRDWAVLEGLIRHLLSVLLSFSSLSLRCSWSKWGWIGEWTRQILLCTAILICSTDDPFCLLTSEPQIHAAMDWIFYFYVYEYMFVCVYQCTKCMLVLLKDWGGCRFSETGVTDSFELFCWC